MYKITISYYSKQQSIIKNIPSLQVGQSMLVKLCQNEDVVGVPQLAQTKTDKSVKKREYT